MHVNLLTNLPHVYFLCYYTTNSCLGYNIFPSLMHPFSGISAKFFKTYHPGKTFLSCIYSIVVWVRVLACISFVRFLQFCCFTNWGVPHLLQIRLLCVLKQLLLQSAPGFLLISCTDKRAQLRSSPFLPQDTKYTNIRIKETTQRT